MSRREVGQNPETKQRREHPVESREQDVRNALRRLLGRKVDSTYFWDDKDLLFEVEKKLTNSFGLTEQGLSLFRALLRDIAKAPELRDVSSEQFDELMQFLNPVGHNERKDGSGIRSAISTNGGFVRPKR